jgi:hypothetical protein
MRPRHAGIDENRRRRDFSSDPPSARPQGSARGMGQTADGIAGQGWRPRRSARPRFDFRARVQAAARRAPGALWHRREGRDRALLRCMDRGSQRATAALSRKQKRDGLRSRVGGRSQLVQGERGDSRARALAVSRMESSSGHARRFVLACGPERVPRIRRAERRGADPMRVSMGGASGKGHSRSCKLPP